MRGRADCVPSLARTTSESTTAPRATSVPARSATLGEPACGTNPIGGVKNQCPGKQHAEQQKKVMAEKMVDAVHELLCSTWSSASDASSFSSARSSSSDECSMPGASASPDCTTALVPLRIFIREILRRSKSSCGTLRCAEWYLTKLRSKLIPAYGSSDAASSASHAALPSDSPLLCPRRAFLAALVLAHKFLHDRVYSNRAWAKVSELDVREISRAELALATALDWNLWVGRADEVEVAAFRADATSAVALETAPGAKDEGLTPTTENIPAAISSWRAGVRQPTSSPESSSPASAMHSGSALGASISVSPEGMDKPADSPAQLVAIPASPAPTIATGLLSAAASQSAFSQASASSCTILSSCLPGLTLDGRSDWDGSVSASGISPNAWVMVTGAAPDVQIVHPGDDSADEVEVDGRPAVAAVLGVDGMSGKGHGLGINHKKRTSPLAIELSAREADENACEHSWEAQLTKRRRVVGGEA